MEPQLKKFQALMGKRGDYSYTSKSNLGTVFIETN